MNYRIGNKVVISDVRTTKEIPTTDLIEIIQDALDELKTRVQEPAKLQVATLKSLSELPVGAIVTDPNTKYYDEPIQWIVAAQGHYGENQTTLLAKNILTFKPFDAKEPNNPDELRQKYGNNEYILSNINQWLNSDKKDWFEKRHQTDQAPTEENVWNNAYADESGFLSDFSQQFKNSLVETSLPVGSHNLGKVVHEIDAPRIKVFLLSRTEVGKGDEFMAPEGRRLPLFENPSYLKASPTKACVEIDEEGEVNEPDWWWLRTPNASHSSNARLVNTSGALDSSPCLRR